MIIKKYKLFENKLDLDKERTNLLEMAIDTGELELVKFFVNKGVKSDNVLYDSAWNDELFRYFLSKGANVKELEDDANLKHVDIQKALIDYGYAQFVFDQEGFNQELKNDPKYKKTIDMIEKSSRFNL